MKKLLWLDDERDPNTRNWLNDFSPLTGAYKVIWVKTFADFVCYITKNGNVISITDEGFSALGYFDPLPTGEELQHYWISELGKAESAILKVLIDNFPNQISKEQIAEACGYAVTSGSFNNSLSKLRTLELVEGRQQIKASESLFS